MKKKVTKQVETAQADADKLVKMMEIRRQNRQRLQKIQNVKKLTKLKEEGKIPYKAPGKKVEQKKEEPRKQELAHEEK